MATYVNNLRLKEIATGDESGTWGTSTNTNLELIGESLGFATQASFSSDADVTTTVADGATDPARALYFKVTSGTSLSTTRTLTIGPNTVSRVMFIENATSGSQSINISQGSGANVTIANGKTALVYLDGAGSGAAVVLASPQVTVSQLTDVTSTASELNLVDGSSAGTIVNSKAVIYGSSGEVNGTTLQIAGNAITSTAAELNLLDGSSAGTIANSKGVIYGSSGEVNATTLQIAGSAITSTAAELNILDGVTATATELNLLDGVTATTTELNYVDITTLGTSQASKALTADANGDVTLSEELIAKSYNETFVTLSGTTPTVDCETGNVFYLSTSGNTTFTFSNPPSSGTAYGMLIKLTAGGTHTISWPGTVDWAGGSAPDAPASGETDILGFITHDGGTIWYGFLAGDALA